MKERVNPPLWQYLTENKQLVSCQAKSGQYCIEEGAYSRKFGLFRVCSGNGDLSGQEPRVVQKNGREKKHRLQVFLAKSGG
jgi:hypothetical protein